MGKWEEKKLQDVCERITDGTHQTPTYFDQGYIFLSSKNVTSQKIDWENVRYVDERQYLEFQKRISPKVGDILLAKNGTTGVAAMVDRDVPFNIYVSLAWLRSKGDVIPEYLLYFINSPNAKKQFNSRLKGVGVPNLHLKEIREVKMAFPKSLTEQQRIVAKLDDLFAKIDQAIGLLEENIAHTQALMGSVLDAEFGRLEETSKVVSISGIADVKGGKRLPKGQKLLEFETDYPYIRVTDFSDNGTIEIDKLKYISKEIHEQISRYIITNDDLYISIAGTIGKTGIIPKELNGANLTENAARLVYKDKSTIDNAFVYYYTKSDKFKRFVEDSTKQVAQPKLALTRLKQIKLALPSLKKQRKVVEKFKYAEEKLIELEKKQTQKLTHLKALKSSLLDQAFKGEL